MSSPPVHAAPSCDGEYVRGEASPLNVPLATPNDRQPDLLNDLLGVGSIRYRPPDEAQQRCTIPRVQETERLVITAAKTQGELLVREGRGSAIAAMPTGV